MPGLRVPSLPVSGSPPGSGTEAPVGAEADRGNRELAGDDHTGQAVHQPSYRKRQSSSSTPNQVRRLLLGTDDRGHFPERPVRRQHGLVDDVFEVVQQCKGG